MALFPLLIGCIDSVIRVHAANQKLTEGLTTESLQRADAEQKLQQISSDSLVRIEAILEQATFNKSFDFILQTCDCIGRLQYLSQVTFDIRTITCIGGAFYVVVRVPDDALPRLREGDRFILTTNGGLRHPIAELRLHQINLQEETVFFKMGNALDETTTAALMGLTQCSGPQNLGNYSVSPEIDISAFRDINMEYAQNAIARLQNELQRQ